MKGVLHLSYTYTKFDRFVLYSEYTQYGWFLHHCIVYLSHHHRLFSPSLQRARLCLLYQKCLALFDKINKIIPDRLPSSWMKPDGNVSLINHPVSFLALFFSLWQFGSNSARRSTTTDSFRWAAKDSTFLSTPKSSASPKMIPDTPWISDGSN